MILIYLVKSKDKNNGNTKDFEYINVLKDGKEVPVH